MFDWLFGRKRAPNPKQPARQAEAKPLPRFPYPTEIVHGREALAAYERLKREGRGTPVILGGDEDFRLKAELLEAEHSDANVDKLLKAAASYDFPAALRAERAAEHAKYSEEGEPELESGDWPASVAPQSFMSASDIRTREPLERVHIALLPTGDATQVPAFLLFGGWNACPDAAVQVAAARYWRERYGAEIVAVTGDVVEYRTKRRPATREEAMTLAREQYDLCEDIVVQGTDTLENLAAILMKSDWWFFWWD